MDVKWLLLKLDPNKGHKENVLKLKMFLSLLLLINVKYCNLFQSLGGKCECPSAAI